MARAKLVNGSFGPDETCQWPERNLSMSVLALLKLVHVRKTRSAPEKKATGVEFVFASFGILVWPSGGILYGFGAVP